FRGCRLLRAVCRCRRLSASAALHAGQKEPTAAEPQRQNHLPRVRHRERDKGAGRDRGTGKRRESVHWFPLPLCSSSGAWPAPFLSLLLLTPLALSFSCLSSL